MNDLFRVIFGIPPKDNYGKRMDDTPPHDYRNNFTRNLGGDMGDDDDDDDNDDNARMNHPAGFFDFNVFNDPFGVSRHFERLISEMNKAFGVFGFDDGAGAAFEDQNRNMSACNECSGQRTENLRDFYLKQPEGVCNQNEKDFNKVNLKFNAPETSNNLTLSSDGPVSLQGAFSKVIYIQKIRKPDGSVEIIQKVRDHTGNEETTITQTKVNDPLLPPEDNEPISKDQSGLSILRKFFSF